MLIPPTNAGADQPNFVARAFGAILTMALVFAIAVWVEGRLGADAEDFVLPNAVGAAILGGLVLTGPTWVSAGGSVLSAGAATVALTFSLTAIEQSRNNADRLQQQDQRRYADKIYQGEPPISVYSDGSDPIAHERCAARSAAVPQCHPTRRGQDIWFVVINASGAQAQDVWVEDDDGQVIAIHGLERCSMYSMPYQLPGATESSEAYTPSVLYFSDPNGHWRRPFGGALEPLHVDEFTAALARASIDADDGDSPWTDILPDCAG